MKKFKFSIEGNKFEVSVEELENNVMEVEVNGSNYMVQIDREGTKAANQAARPASPAAAPKAAPKAAPLAPQAASAAAASVKTIKSQLPGSVVKVLVEVGQTVKKGETILTIESMKMENNIMAEADGKIAKIYVEPGKNVMQDDKLVDIEVSASATAAPAPVSAPAKPAAPAQPAAPKAAPAAGAGKPIKSPLPGSIIKILVTEGQAVKRGETLLTMESMKMENEIKAERDGVVTAIKVAVGQNVMQDDDLVMMA